jgi:ribonuclease-3
MDVELARLEEGLGVRFADQSLLRQALVHRSYLNENPDFPLPSNERLEFLGDALLDFIVGEYLYLEYPEMDEGRLTSLRAALINGSALAQLARQVGLGSYVYLSRGEEEMGGRERVGLLSDAFEALVAAIYLDRGFEATVQFVTALVAPEAAHIVEGGLDRDFKSRLQEWTQRELGVTPAYRTVLERGPDHAKEFTVEVVVNGEVYGVGLGRSKQAAEQEAAKGALGKVVSSEG